MVSDMRVLRSGCRLPSIKGADRDPMADANFLYAVLESSFFKDLLFFLLCESRSHLAVPDQITWRIVHQDACPAGDAYTWSLEYVTSDNCAFLVGRNNKRPWHICAF